MRIRIPALTGAPELGGSREERYHRTIGDYILERIIFFGRTSGAYERRCDERRELLSHFGRLEAGQHRSVVCYPCEVMEYRDRLHSLRSATIIVIPDPLNDALEAVRGSRSSEDQHLSYCLYAHPAFDKEAIADSKIATIATTFDSIKLCKRGLDTIERYKSVGLDVWFGSDKNISGALGEGATSVVCQSLSAAPQILCEMSSFGELQEHVDKVRTVLENSSAEKRSTLVWLADRAKQG